MKRNFISLYDECFDALYKYIYFKTGSKWDTDDIVSEVFRRAYERFDTVNGSPKAWLFTIARNAVIDYYRRPRTSPFDESVESDGSLSQGDAVENHLMDKDEIACLKKSLENLSEEELEIIRLKYFSNLKYREISQLLGKEQSSIRTKACRILKKLKIIMSQYMEG